MLAVVSDSSPLIYLTRLDQMPLLQRLHERVIVPQAVWQEVAIGGMSEALFQRALNAAGEG
jgi:predicted nucleic acid-binding protein